MDFAFTFHEKRAYFLKDFCIVLYEKSHTRRERERERERELLEKLLVLILLHVSHGFCHTFQETCAYFLKDYGALFQEKPIEGDLIDKLLVLILAYFSHGLCPTFQKKTAYLLRNYCIFFQKNRYSKREIESEGDLLEKLLALSLVHISHGFCFYFFMKMCILFKLSLIHI